MTALAQLTLYPKGYEENIAWRVAILRRVQVDKDYRAMVRALFFKDFIFALNAFYYTLDVRTRPRHNQPFCTYPFQDQVALQIIDHITRGEDLAIEKSRDMGMSWLVLLVFHWMWLNPDGGSDFLLGSRKEDYVDEKGNMRTLFQKIRYAHYKLPSWLWPKGFDSKKHDNYLRIVNPETGASLTGESNNPNFSTGGRYLAALFDEFAKWESTDQSAWTAAGDATPCRIPVSTANGANGQFYNLVTDGKTKKTRLDWWLHPKKSEGLYCEWPQDEVEGVKLRSPWYDRECQRRSPLEVAQEIDIDYIGAGNPVFSGKDGKRVGRLLKSEHPAKGYFEVSLGDASLRATVNPRDLEAIVCQWFDPIPGDSYTLGVDVAEGKETGDYSIVKVYSRKLKSCFASYFSHIDEVQLAKVVRAISNWLTGLSFEPPWIGIETNGPGLATFDFCAEAGVENLFMMPQYDVTTGSISHRKGWNTNNSSRNMLIAGVRDWLLQGEGWLDPRCCRELTTFVRSKLGKAEAKPGTHDDEVIAWGIALQIAELVPSEALVEKAAPNRGPVIDLAPNPQPDPSWRPPTLEELCLATLVKQASERNGLSFENEIVFH